MNKQEFIDRLRAALNGRVSPELVAENIHYYEDYINMEIRKGRTETEILQALGDPRLIARTIIETNGKNEQSDYQNADYQSNGYRNTGYQGGGNTEPSGEIHRKIFRLPLWAWIIIITMVVILLMGVILSILTFLAPVIATVVVVVLLVKLFRDWLN